MSRFTLHEPFPTYDHVNSMSFGRGGAGNRTSSTVPSKKRSQLPPSTITVDTTHAHHNNRYSCGRGGAGNMPRATGDERAMFHFDEELKSRGHTAAPVYHVGRGGQGNTVDARRRGSHGSSTGSEKSDAGSSVHKGLDWVKGLARK